MRPRIKHMAGRYLITFRDGETINVYLTATEARTLMNTFMSLSKLNIRQVELKERE